MEMNRELLGKLVTEFVGTGMLAFTVATSIPSGSVLTPLAIGSVLMCFIYAGGHVSGAHYNPAVTLAVAIRKKIPWMEAALYAFSQCAGALIFGGLASCMYDDVAGISGYPALTKGATVECALLAEFVITFALAHTVLHVATSSRTANNSYYGLAIGFVVVSGAASVGKVSGGAFNPALAFLAVWHDEPGDMWVHIVGPLLGGLMAGFTFVASNPSEMLDPPRTRSESVEEAWPFYADQAVEELSMEFIGTFMLCFTVGCAAAPGNGTMLAPLSIGGMLMSMVYAGGATSGANYNPAVTLGVYLRFGNLPSFGTLDPSKMPMPKAAAYILTQCFAAVIGGGVARAVFSGLNTGGGYNSNIGFPVPALQQGAPGGAALAETFGTLALVYVVLNTATAAKTSGNHDFGLAIGMTVTAMAVAVGGHSGGAFNPAVGLLGLVAGGDKSRAGLWIYWVACPIGALFAAQLFHLLHHPDDADASRQNNLHATHHEGISGDHHVYHSAKVEAVEEKPAGYTEPPPAAEPSEVVASLEVVQA